MESLTSAKPFVAQRHPDDADNSLLLSVHVFEIADRGPRQRGRRTIQEDFIRSGGKGTSKRQASLCGEGWLKAAKPKNPLAATTYDYGTNLKPGPLRDEWRELSERIWGPGGYLRGWMGDPLFAHGALGWSGTLVYAVLMRHPGEFRSSEIQRFFGGMFSPAQTARQVRKLHKKGLLTLKCNRFELHPEHIDKAEKIRLKFSYRRERITYVVAQERRRHRAALGISDEYERIRAAYRGFPCIRCSQPSDQVEHFPPVKWYGEDDWFLTYPICGGCNGETSRFIRANNAPARLTVRKVSLIGGSPLRALEERLARYRDTFYSCVENGQVNRALQSVAKARATFEAHTGDSGALVFRLPSGMDFRLDPTRHGLLLNPEILTTSKPSIDPSLTRVPIRRKGANPMRTRGTNFKGSDKSK